jgi:hypothetical protein
MVYIIFLHSLSLSLSDYLASAFPYSYCNVCTSFLSPMTLVAFFSSLILVLAILSEGDMQGRDSRVLEGIAEALYLL